MVMVMVRAGLGLLLGLELSHCLVGSFHPRSRIVAAHDFEASSVGVLSRKECRVRLGEARLRFQALAPVLVPEPIIFDAAPPRLCVLGTLSLAAFACRLARRLATHGEHKQRLGAGPE